MFIYISEWLRDQGFLYLEQISVASANIVSSVVIFLTCPVIMYGAVDHNITVKILIFTVVSPVYVPPWGADIC